MNPQRKPNYLLIFVGVLFVITSLCGSNFPSACATIADGLDRGELLPVNKNQVKTTFLGALFYDNVKGLTDANMSDTTHKYYNVSSQCGDPNTMVERAYESGVLKKAAVPAGAVGFVLIVIGFFVRPKSTRRNLSSQTAAA